MKKLPTPAQMRKFAKEFKAEWQTLCANQEFLDIFTEDLDKARKLAKKIILKRGSF